MSSEQPQEQPHPVMRRFPAWPGYEVFNDGVWLAGFMILGYVVFPPTAPAEDALQGPFTFAPAWVWGLAVGAFALVCATASYWPRWRARACVGLMSAAALWAIFIAVGIFAWDAPDRAWVTFWLYAGIASRCWRLKVHV